MVRYFNHVMIILMIVIVVIIHFARFFSSQTEVNSVKTWSRTASFTWALTGALSDLMVQADSAVFAFTIP